MYLIEKTLGNINSRGELDLSAEGIKHRSRRPETASGNQTQISAC